MAVIGRPPPDYNAHYRTILEWLKGFSPRQIVWRDQVVELLPISINGLKYWEKSNRFLPATPFKIRRSGYRVVILRDWLETRLAQSEPTGF